jgi:hypothetical protein
VRVAACRSQRSSPCRLYRFCPVCRPSLAQAIAARLRDDRDPHTVSLHNYAELALARMLMIAAGHARTATTSSGADLMSSAGQGDTREPCWSPRGLCSARRARPTMAGGRGGWLVSDWRPAEAPGSTVAPHKIILDTTDGLSASYRSCRSTGYKSSIRAITSCRPCRHGYGRVDDRRPFSLLPRHRLPS